MFRIFLEQFRQPDAHLGFFFEKFTMGQLLSIPLIITGLVVIVISLKNKKGLEKNN